MDENKVAILELILEENRDMKKGINALVEENRDMKKGINSLVEENQDIKRSINGLAESLLKHVVETDKKFNRVNESLELIVNELTRLRGDLAEMNNSKILKLEDRLTKLENTIYSRGA